MPALTPPRCALREALAFMGALSEPLQIWDDSDDFGDESQPKRPKCGGV